MLQIEPLLDRKPAQLSGGQRQRVAIGRALVKHAGVLLFDEPLSNLDAKLRTEMRLEIKRLHEELKPTVVYVTHDQIEAMTMATRIAVMNGGVIQQFGIPDEIYERPANLFVAGFIGAPAMNLKRARIAKDDGKVQAVFASGLRFDLDGYRFAGHPDEGAEVVVGMRPEHFAAPGTVPRGRRRSSTCRCATPSAPGRTRPATSTSRTASCRCGSSRGSRPDLVAGQRVAVGFPRGKANLFDARSGLRL